MVAVALGDVIDVDRGIASEDECRTMPYVGLEHIEKECGRFSDDFRPKPQQVLATKFQFTPQHVLYGKLRPYLNKVALPYFRGVCTTEILPLLPKAGKLERGFLYAVLLSPRFVNWASQNVSGANLPRLGPDRLLEYEVELPDLAEQKRIAAILERADRLRRLRRYGLETAKSLLPAVFFAFFGDPAANPHAFPVTKVDALWLSDDEGVKCGPFGTALKKHECVAAGIPVWTMDNIVEDEFVDTGLMFVTPAKFEELSSYSAKNEDILVSRAGTVGKMAVVHSKAVKAIIHSNLIRLRFDTGKILPVYFTTMMNHFPERLGKLKRGQEDAYTFMSTHGLADLTIPLPPLALQEEFAAALHEQRRLRRIEEESLRQAEHLFQALLHRAFTSGL